MKNQIKLEIEKLDKEFNQLYQRFDKLASDENADHCERADILMEMVSITNKKSALVNILQK